MFKKFATSCCCGAIFCALALLAPAEPASREYQIKAAFLFNFVRFVQWPEKAFARADAPLVIGVLGDDPFDGALEDVIHGERIERHQLILRRAKKIGDLKGCQLIFVSKSESTRLPQIMTELNDDPTVTVSEVADFAKQGGTINFYRDENKVRFEINPAAARQRGLKISSQLLALGRIVQSY